jgi:crossover junction endodeoxyribonuclease RuvC
MILILGLDIATTTGYGVIKNNNLIKYGKFTLAGDEYRLRFKQFRKQILELIKEYKPKIVIIEQTYVGVNVKTTAYLNMLKGICTECIPENIKIIAEAPSKIRKEVLGEGKKHTKEEIFEYLTKKFNIKDLNIKKDLDITDGILLALWGSYKK